MNVLEAMMVDEFTNGFVSRAEVRTKMTNELVSRAHSAGVINTKTWGQTKSSEAALMGWQAT